MTRYVTTVATLVLCLLLAWECGSRVTEAAVDAVPPVFAAAAAQGAPVEQLDLPPVTTTTTAPTTTTTVAPALAPAPASRPTGEETLVALVRDTFPEDPETAVRIVSCESGWNPAAVSHTDDHGLFQIHAPIHLGPGGVAAGLSREDLHDPATNVRVARILFDQSGWQPWVCW